MPALTVPGCFPMYSCSYSTLYIPLSTTLSIFLVFSLNQSLLSFALSSPSAIILFYMSMLSYEGSFLHFFHHFCTSKSQVIYPPHFNKVHSSYCIQILKDPYPPPELFLQFHHITVLHSHTYEWTSLHYLKCGNKKNFVYFSWWQKLVSDVCYIQWDSIITSLATCKHFNWEVSPLEFMKGI